MFCSNDDSKCAPSTHGDDAASTTLFPAPYGNSPTLPHTSPQPAYGDYRSLPPHSTQTNNARAQQLKRSFGLIDTSPERWHNLRKSIEELQRKAPEGVTYKVFFLGRHGQGWHNFGASKYGHDVSCAAALGGF